MQRKKEDKDEEDEDDEATGCDGHGVTTIL